MMRLCVVVWLCGSSALLADARGVNPNPARNCCANTHVNIHLPNHSIHPFWIHHPDRESPANYQGYAPVMFDKLFSEMGVTYTFVPMADMADVVTGMHYPFNGTLEAIFLYPMESKLTFSELFSTEIYTYSIPVYSSSQGALVHLTHQKQDVWRFLGPLSGGVWIAFGVGTFLLGLAVVLLRCTWPGPEELNEPPASATGVAKALYEACAMCFGGEDWEHRMLTWPFRLVRLAVLIFVLVFISTYTANLAAFFTAPNYTIHGPKSPAELASSVACTPMVESEWTRSPLRDFFKDVVSAPPGMSYQEALDFCKGTLVSGDADIFVNEYNALHQYHVSRHANCHDLADRSTLVSAILPSYAAGFFMMSNFHGNAYFNSKLNSAILHGTEQPEYIGLLDETFNLKTSCDAVEEVSETEPVKYESMAGLFILCGSMVLLALVMVGIARAFDKVRPSNKTDADVRPSNKSDAEHFSC